MLVCYQLMTKKHWQLYFIPVIFTDQLAPVYLINLLFILILTGSLWQHIFFPHNLPL